MFDDPEFYPPPPSKALTDACLDVLMIKDLAQGERHWTAFTRPAVGQPEQCQYVIVERVQGGWVIHLMGIGALFNKKPIPETTPRVQLVELFRQLRVHPYLNHLLKVDPATFLFQHVPQGGPDVR